MTFKKLTDVAKTIRTAKGEAKYYGTEIEDVNGRWDDHYAIRDGFWVIHDGMFHHIYKSEV